MICPRLEESTKSFTDIFKYLEDKGLHDGELWGEFDVGVRVQYRCTLTSDPAPLLCSCYRDDSQQAVHRVSGKDGSQGVHVMVSFSCCISSLVCLFVCYVCVFVFSLLTAAVFRNWRNWPSSCSSSSTTFVEESRK